MRLARRCTPAPVVAHLGHIRLTEHSQSPLTSIRGSQLILVVDDLVSSLPEDLVIVLFAWGSRSGDPLLGTTSEEDVRAGPRSPVRVVRGDSVEVHLGDRGVLASLYGRNRGTNQLGYSSPRTTAVPTHVTGMSNQRSRSSIRQESSRDDPDLSTSLPVED